MKRGILVMTGLTAVTMIDMPEPAQLNPSATWFANQKTIQNPEYDFLVTHITESNPAIERSEAERLARVILKEAAMLRMPATAQIDGKPVNPVHFVTAVVETESTFKRMAVSKADARGYMQVMPATLLWIRDKSNLPVDPNDIHDTEVNMMLGVHYLSLLFDEFKEPHLVSLAYNAGPGNLKRGVYDVRYWLKVKRFYRALQQKKAG